MKKIYYYLTVAAVVLGSAAACNKLEVSEQNKSDEASTDAPIKLNITVSDLSPGTKAVKSGWEDGDVIHLWLDNSSFGDPNHFTDFNQFNSYDAPLTYNADKDEWIFQGLQLNESLLKETGGYIRGLYEATNMLFSETDRKKERSRDEADPDRAIWWNINLSPNGRHPNIWYDGPGGTGKRGRLGVLTAVCDSIPYTYNKETKVLTAKIDKWRFPTDFQLVVTGLNYEQFKYTLNSDQIYSVLAIDVRAGDAPYSCWIADRDWQPDIAPLMKSGSEDGNIAGVENADGVAFVGKLRYSGKPTKYTFTLVELEIDNNKKTQVKKEYTLSIPEEMTLDSQNGSKLVAVKVPFQYFQTGWKSHPAPTAVDLGLPSGIKWATCNVGADTPEGYGDYFAWGETTAKETYDWNTYSLTSDGGSTFSRYNFSDNKTVLAPEDDAATKNCGSAWRMPTGDEFDELENNCNWTWITQNGVNGYRVVSRKNGASIFLPAAGYYRYGDSLDGVGSSGYYWSSSLPWSDSSSARDLQFKVSNAAMDVDSRFCGLPVRPVSDK